MGQTPDSMLAYMIKSVYHIEHLKYIMILLSIVEENFL